jgi:triacylglycerol esterase/lipase EstA (alpha/beta hydrolase family)
MRVRSLRTSAAAVVVLGVLIAVLTPATSASAAPSDPPPGSNDWSCRSTAHPNPVVLVHGTFENMEFNWRTLSPYLANKDYCVFAFNFGNTSGDPNAFIQGIGRIQDSARELSTFVDRVLEATGAREVDIVGHSQGGMMPRYYLKFLGGADKVRTLVGIAPSNHGTTLLGLVNLGEFLGIIDEIDLACPACTQQIRGSEFLANLNDGGDTVPGVSYTVIATRTDEVVTPYDSAFLSGSDVTNITIQDQCPLDLAPHVSLAHDKLAMANTTNALDPANARRVDCSTLLE